MLAITPNRNTTKKTPFCQKVSSSRQHPTSRDFILDIIFCILSQMHSKVRDLYKRVLLAGRSNYPGDFGALKQQAKEKIRENSQLSTDSDITKAVGYGRNWVREVEAIGKLHKYRAMRKRYG